MYKYETDMIWREVTFLCPRKASAALAGRPVMS